MNGDDKRGRQPVWPRLRARFFHSYFLLSRPMTLGVRALVHDGEARRIFLIRHTYVPGWYLPGGGVEKGETIREALARELSEEANIELLAEPALRSLHLNRQASLRDHVALYVVESFRQTAPKLPDREIAESGFFPLDALPPGLTPATARRIEEVFGAAAASPYW